MSYWFCLSLGKNAFLVIYLVILYYNHFIFIFNFFVIRLAKFVDKFGARLSGSEVLENSIDYMIDLTKNESSSSLDITTEELEVGIECCIKYSVINK